MLEAKRTLVKSAPELWAEVSDPVCLARHLAPFGSIRITSTQPDALVVWEGERGSGSVRLEPSGFGTKVTLVAEPAVPEPEPAPEPQPLPEPGFWGRLFRRRPEPPPALPPAAPPEPAIADATALVVLTDMLDVLGRANHRPFSRV
jgi:hypothetical protein